MERAAWMFTGGEGPDKSIGLGTLPAPACICAADSGVDLALSLGLTPDFAVGDFDSIVERTALERITHASHPTDKDLTDSELLLRHIRTMNIPYVLFGGGGRRFDHLVQLYGLFERYGAPLVWLTARETMHTVEHCATFSLEAGTTCSILPAIPSGFSRVTSHNLVWELENYAISLVSISISNRVKASPISLQVEGSPIFFSIITTP
jgi:thiamine pyrophosphokinase